MTRHPSADADRFEETLRSVLRADADLRAPTQLLAVVERSLRETPAARSGGWLPSITASTFEAMFSATKFVVAGIIVALFGGFLLTGVLTQPSKVVPPAAALASPDPDSTPTWPASESPSESPVSGQVIVVSQVGDGDARTIGEAVEMAEAGDTIVVREPFDPLDHPYLMEAGLMITKDITLRGDGDREHILVWVTDPRQPGSEDDVLVQGAMVVIENLTFLREGDAGVSLDVSGGSLTLRDVTLDHTGVSSGDSSHLLIQGSDLIDASVYTNGSAIIEDSRLLDSCIYNYARGDAVVVIRGNVIARTSGAEPPCVEAGGGGFLVSDRGLVVVESNTLTGVGVRLSNDAGDAGGSSVRDNQISGADTAITVSHGSSVSIERNTLRDNATAISLLDADVLVADNTISGNDTGLDMAGSAATVRGNDISDNDLGISVVGTSVLPSFIENSICRNGANLRVVGGGQVSLDGNEVCPETTPAAVVALGTGPHLTWEQVEPGFAIMKLEDVGTPLWVAADRFLVADAGGGVHTSSDGLAWTAVEDETVPTGYERTAEQGGREVAWLDNSSALDITGFGASPTERTFRGPIGAAAVSPAGIVVVENLTRRDVIEDVLGAEVAEGDWRLVKEDFPPGSWWIETGTGELVEIVLAEHGYGGLGRDDVNSATLGWHSPDGVAWTPIRGVPMTHQDDLAGTEEGFFWLHGDDPGWEVQSLWFSADGLAWAELGKVTGWGPRWQGGLLVERDGRQLLATAEGLEELPMSRETLGADGAFGAFDESLSAGRMGLIHIDAARGLVLFSPDGSQWSLGDAPAAWSAPATSVDAVAVGLGAVLVHVYRCADPNDDVYRCVYGYGFQEMSDDDPVSEAIPSLWRGSVEP